MNKSQLCDLFLQVTGGTCKVSQELLSLPREQKEAKDALNDGVAQYNFSFYRLHCLLCEEKTGGRKSERGVGITPVCCP